MGDKRGANVFGGKTWGLETTWKTEGYMGGEH
jgi:hypothetical protein